MTTTETLQTVAQQAAGCTKCELHFSRKRSVPGAGAPDAEIMFIGEGPGFHENEQGLPFVGAAGKFLDELLAGIGFGRDQVFITNVVKCRPPGNRDPRPEELAACDPYLEKQIHAINPKVIVTLGKFAGQLLLRSKEGITRLRGRSYPFATGVLVPTVHPAYVLRGGGGPMAQMRAEMAQMRAELMLLSCARSI